MNDPTSDLALARLLRLASPALPVGACGYSQGLETAVGRGWLRDEADIERWIGMEQFRPGAGDRELPARAPGQRRLFRP